MAIVAAGCLEVPLLRLVTWPRDRAARAGNLGEYCMVVWRRGRGRERWREEWRGKAEREGA